MSSMFPSFPPHNLAKLVLGYLAEEQLMTAYDEFLQASPHLDALENEYDRIFMTSLKTILAEYTALKIHVETCKPLCLRKRLLQCNNLVDVIDFLIKHIDVNLINSDNTFSKKSVEHQSSGQFCEFCKCKGECTCRKRCNEVSQVDHTHSRSQIDTTMSIMSNTYDPRNYTGHIGRNEKNKSVAHNTTQTGYQVPVHNANNDSNTSKTVYPVNNTIDVRCNQSHKTSLNTNRLSMDYFDEFASGVGGANSLVATVTNSHTQYSSTPALDSNTGKKTQYLLQISTKKNSFKQFTSQLQLENQCPPLEPIKDHAKCEENKVKILSDVLVDDKIIQNKTSNNHMTPAVVKNSKDSTLVQAQTIYINSTPVYTSDKGQNIKTFTRDEIMSMPTLILVPTSAPKNVPSTTIKPTQTMVQPVTTTSVNTSSSTVDGQQLGPLTIDVSSTQSMPILNLGSETKKPVKQNTHAEENASANKPVIIPKNSTIDTKTSTPHALPVRRKSSSTPRRTSHIRILDFNTPRKILHETINENPTVARSESSLQINTSTNITQQTNVVQKDSNLLTKLDPNPTSDGSAKENNVTNTGKKVTNWDADLRALIGSSTPSNASKTKPRVRKKKEEKTDGSNTEPTNHNLSQKKCEEQSKSIKKKAHKSNRKKNTDLAEIVKETEAIKDIIVDLVSVKPTINFITDWNTEKPGSETKKPQNKSNDSLDTPEAERLSLQNVIGTKLNISDLLETPYKQALYDIQMDTPRFLRPDIPGDSSSEIKITDIPTPRFLDTPNLAYAQKPLQGTPASYNSRPTDYSSGGSYYKPDELDIVPLSDYIGGPGANVTSKQTSSKSQDMAKTDDKNNTQTKKDKSNTRRNSRPVRQCTKNVSYRGNKVGKKTNTSTSKSDSSLSNSSSEDYDDDDKTIKNDKLKLSKDDITKDVLKVTLKVDKKSTKSKRASTNSNTRKSPKKRATKPFIKIKPRQPTPKSVEKNRRKTIDIVHSVSKKRTNSKEKSLLSATISAGPTKSRRKSSTPRKYQGKICSDSSSPSPESTSKKDDNKVIPTDSDVDPPLRWSDDCSQDVNSKLTSNKLEQETEDISKIEAFIKEENKSKEKVQTPVFNYKSQNHVEEGSLHIDLIKRGFDIETAKSIERDLLDTPLGPEINTKSVIVDVAPCLDKLPNLDKSDLEENTTIIDKNTDTTIESEQSNTLQIDEMGEDDELELSEYECNELSCNYFEVYHEESKEPSNIAPVKLKDTFSMEICIDDVAIRLRATPLVSLFEENPEHSKETEAAVESISSMDKLYTPMKVDKTSIEAQCLEIFDSTLNSIDTPIKDNNSSNNNDFNPKKINAEIVIEVEQIEETVTVKEKTKKRKREKSSSDESIASSKKSKPGARLNLPNIKNIDIESVLSKLHGP